MWVLHTANRYSKGCTKSEIIRGEEPEIHLSTGDTIFSFPCPMSKAKVRDIAMDRVDNPIVSSLTSAHSIALVQTFPIVKSILSTEQKLLFRPLLPILLTQAHLIVDYTSDFNYSPFGSLYSPPPTPIGFTPNALLKKSPVIFFGSRLLTNAILFDGDRCISTNISTENPCYWPTHLNSRNQYTAATSIHSGNIDFFPKIHDVLADMKYGGVLFLEADVADLLVGTHGAKNAEILAACFVKNLQLLPYLPTLTIVLGTANCIKNELLHSAPAIKVFNATLLYLLTKINVSFIDPNEKGVFLKYYQNDPILCKSTTANIIGIFDRDGKKSRYGTKVYNEFFADIYKSVKNLCLATGQGLYEAPLTL